MISAFCGAEKTASMTEWADSKIGISSGVGVEVRYGVAEAMRSESESAGERTRVRCSAVLRKKRSEVRSNG